MASWGVRSRQAPQLADRLLNTTGIRSVRKGLPATCQVFADAFWPRVRDTEANLTSRSGNQAFQAGSFQFVKGSNRRIGLAVVPAWTIFMHDCLLKLTIHAEGRSVARGSAAAGMAMDGTPPQPD